VAKSHSGKHEEKEKGGRQMTDMCTLCPFKYMCREAYNSAVMDLKDELLYRIKAELKDYCPLERHIYTNFIDKARELVEREVIKCQQRVITTY